MSAPSQTKEYRSGWNRGRARATHWAWVVIGIAKGYRARLADIDTARRCDTCSRWTRGRQGCVWGKCAANFERGAEPAMWADGTRSGQPIAVITTEDFGCVNWLPDAPLATKGGAR